MFYSSSFTLLIVSLGKVVSLGGIEALPFLIPDFFPCFKVVLIHRFFYFFIVYIVRASEKIVVCAFVIFLEELE